jgi:hypothetical protein
MGKGKGSWKQEALHEKLAHKLTASCADGEANGNFLLPAGSASQKQVGNVGTGDEQY